MTENKMLKKNGKGENEFKDLVKYIGRNYLIDRDIAASELSSSEILKSLAISCDKEVRYNVVRNINTSTETLISLSKEFPKEFFEHPLFDLLLLENPHFLQDLEPGTLQMYLKEPECATYLVLWASKHGSKGEQLEILKRDDLTVEQLKFIANGIHPKAVERAIEYLIELGKSW